MNKKELAKYIDHTLLKPTATEADILKLCDEAKKYQFASVCINPCWIPLAKKTLENTEIKICTVIGFPLGANQTSIKQLETESQNIKVKQTFIYLCVPGLICGMQNFYLHHTNS